MKLKQHWKNAPLWLKGGIIAVILFIILTVVLIPTGGQSILGYWMIPSLLSFILTYFLAGKMYLSWDHVVPLSLILSVIFYFVIGAVIGKIVSKIKSRK